MSECISNRFLADGQLRESVYFSDSLINNGTSLYEVIRVIEGKYLFLEDHLDRLQNSLRLFGFEREKTDISLYIKYLLNYKRETEINEGNIKLVVNFQDADKNNPNCYVYQINHSYPEPNNYKTGVYASLTSGQRINPNVKFLNHKIRILVLKEFTNKPVYETFLVNEDGNITEGSKSNLFLIKDNSVYTSPDDTVLQGITRKHVIDICADRNIPVIQKLISADSLTDYNAAFLTGTSAKVMPVRQIDQFIFSPGNELLQMIMNAYNEKIEDYITKSTD